MSFAKYIWLIVVCGVIAPVVGGLLLAIPVIPVRFETMADIPAGFVLFGIGGLLFGSIPGLIAGILLALLRYRTGRLSWLVCMVTVLACVAVFNAWLEIAALTASQSMQGFVGAFAMMAVPAVLAVTVIWLLRDRLGLKELSA